MSLSEARKQASEAAKPPRPARVVVLCEVAERVGVLRDVLDVFDRHALSLDRIESVESTIAGADHRFILTLSEAASATLAANAADELGKLTGELRQYAVDVSTSGGGNIVRRRRKHGNSARRADTTRIGCVAPEVAE